MTENQESDGVDVPITVEESTEASGRERLGHEAERAKDGFDKGVVDVLSWLLETDTKARIYVYLRAEPARTSEEIAAGTGLYPSTVREALAQLHSDEVVTREKRETEETGNNPFEYRAIAPSELVQSMVGRVQQQLNDVFTLDRSLEGDEHGTDVDPITINIDPEADDEDEG